MPRFDTHAPLLSLPRIFGTTLKNIPAEVPYLVPDPQTAERWRVDLDAAGGFKVGIAWQGSRTHRRDLGRSIPLAVFAPLAGVPGAKLYSLQKIQQGGTAQVASATRSTTFRHRLETFDDTAAAVKDLDLVISCDTSLAHLAGGLGIPVWVAIGTVPDWRWLLGRDDSPWYPTLRLFRQRQRGEWQMFARMAECLAQR